jgi:hypothetical protein
VFLSFDTDTLYTEDITIRGSQGEDYMGILSYLCNSPVNPKAFKSKKTETKDILETSLLCLGFVTVKRIPKVSIL